MKKIMLICLLAFYVSNIFAMGGTVPAGLPSTFGFGVIDKADSYATSGPHFWKDNQGTTCWDYSYAYLTPGWTTWVSGGAWARQEMQYWEGKGQIMIFTFYYTPYARNNYTQATWMTNYLNDFKLLCQIINQYSTKKVIIHLEPDLLGFWRKEDRRGATDAGIVSVGGSNFDEVCDGVNINTLPNTIQGWSEALYRIRNQYAPTKALLAHHYTHWGNIAAKDVIVDSSLSQTDVNTNVDDTTAFINAVENGKRFDLIFIDPADRDADWFRIVGGQTNTRWTDPTHTYTAARSWGKLGYIYDRVSTNTARRLMFWQMPVGNTYYKTCNNSSNHYRDNSAQEFLPSTSADGSSGTPGDAYTTSDTTKGPGYWAARGVIGVLFGEGGYDQYVSPNDMTHTRDWPNDGTTNPGSDANAGGPSFNVWGKATSSVSDNDGGYIRNAVARYCATGKYSLGGSVNTPTRTAVSTFTRTNTPVIPSATFTRTNTPVIPTSTFTRTNTPVIPTSTFTRTNTPVIPTSTFTRTNTPVIPTSTFTRTHTPVIPTSTFTRTNTPVIPSATFTRTNTPLVDPTDTYTPTVTRTSTAVIPSQTFTSTRTRTSTPLPTATSTNPPAGATNTFTVTVTRTLIPSNTFTQTFTVTRTATPVPTFTFTNTPQPSATSTNPPAGASHTNTPVNTPVLSPTFTVTRTNTAVNTATATRTNTPPATAYPTAVSTATFTATVIPQATPTFTSTAIPEGEALMIPQPPVAYPNPNPGQQVNISFEITRHATNLTVKMYTISRRLIRKVTVDGNFSAGKCAVSINREYLIGLSKGSYLYQISVSDNEGREAKSKTGVIIIQ